VKSGDRTLRQGDLLSRIWIFDVMPMHRDSELVTMAEHFFGREYLDSHLAALELR
jgi:hypothetical protein